MLWEGKSALVGGHGARKPILLRTRSRGMCVYVGCDRLIARQLAFVERSCETNHLIRQILSLKKRQISLNNCNLKSTLRQKLILLIKNEYYYACLCPLRYLQRVFELYDGIHTHTHTLKSSKKFQSIFR